MLAVEWPVVRASVRARAEGETEDEELSPAMLELQELKERVPEVRARLGKRQWDLRVNRARARDEVEVASRAYHKMREIQLSCALPIPEVSVHLCEAPGGFVQAVGVDASPTWRWTATSLASGKRGAPAPAMHLLRADAGRFVEGDVRDAAHVAFSAGEYTSDAGVPPAQAEGYGQGRTSTDKRERRQ